MLQQTKILTKARWF